MNTEPKQKDLFDLFSGDAPAPAKFVSEEDALAALAIVRARLVSTGYAVARRLAEAHGTVQAQEVWAEMDRQGLLSDSDKALPGNWLGVVFKGKEFKAAWEHTGYVKIGNKERNVHAAPRSLWRLRREEAGS